MATVEKPQLNLKEKEIKLIILLREIPYGQVLIYMEQSQPARVEVIRESIKF